MRIVLLLFVSLAACGQADTGTGGTSNAEYNFKPDSNRKYPQVSGTDTPTIAELKKRGLLQTDWDVNMYACGPSCDAVYQYAVFMGNRKAPPAPAEDLYTCPNPERAMNQDLWKCESFKGKKERPSG